MNDNYVSDLVTNLSAVIDELDKQGYIDRTRLGIGGHSYGGFSTMNALAHTPSSRRHRRRRHVQRTLTPTSFQNERATSGSAEDVRGDVAVLLRPTNAGRDPDVITRSRTRRRHGPISSIRMMQAMRANGKTASLFMYPYEDHGPATKESDLDQWARWTAWLDIYVKHANDKKQTVVP